jgi:4-alpha-glucanotransferase
MDAATGRLGELAAALGIATEFWDWRGQRIDVPAETVVAVLRALDVDASTPEAVEAALAAREDASWRRMLPPCIVVRSGEAGRVDVHVPHGAPVHIRVECEDGERREDVRQVDNWSPPRTLDGRAIGEASFELPTDLPLGYHRLVAESDGETASSLLAVTPDRLPAPPRLGARRAWGLAAQLYSVRSRRSWGVGDLADLADLATWSAVEHGAGFVLVNPLHAAAPVAPMEPSPYLPATRRFANPLYLRVELIPEFAYLDAAGWAAVFTARAGAPREGDRIDRDAAWAAKRAALRTVFAVPRSPGREAAFRGYRDREGDGLRGFATWCAIADEHGADWRRWPEPLRDPRSPEVAAFADEHRADVEFHAWLQWVLDEQLAAVQDAATRSGMPLGVVHDLAVGVDPAGAEAWALPDVFAQRVTVGAPPDAYNQAGQDWEQPPWRPDRLAEVGYAPFRQMVATVLRHAGGLRVDHVIGLFRLWWIPAGAEPTAGTYVRYDHDALIGILALEAHRAGAVVVGEDLGTVEPWVRDYLRERGVFGTSVLWFESDWSGDGGPLPAERWRSECLASVTTHDLPPTMAYLAGDHVRLREELGVLTRPVEEELAAARDEQAAWLAELVRAGDLESADAPPGAVLLALHRYLGRTPSRLLCLALTDAVGDRRAQNQPGTREEYPNWRVPLSGPDGTAVLLEDVLRDPRVAEVAEVMRGAAAS